MPQVLVVGTSSSISDMGDIELPPPVLDDDEWDQLAWDRAHGITQGMRDLYDDMGRADDMLPPSVGDDESDAESDVSLPALDSDDEPDEWQYEALPPSVGGHCNCKRKRCNDMFTPEFTQNMRQEQTKRKKKIINSLKNKTKTICGRISSIAWRQTAEPIHSTSSSISSVRRMVW